MNLTEGLPRLAYDNEPVAIDLEVFGQTDGRLHKPEGTFACLSITIGDGDTYVVTRQDQLKDALDLVSAGKWIFHNAVYDIRQLRRWVDIPRRIVWDTMLVERNLWNGYYSNFSLADLARRYLDKRRDKSIRQSFPDGTELTSEMIQYAGDDAYDTLMCYYAQQEVDGNLDAYFKVDEPAIWVVLDMKPVKIDIDKWTRIVVANEKRGQQLQEELGFNVKSPQQVKKATHALGFDLENTAKATLQDMSDKHPIFDSIVEARMYRDSVSRYGIKWINRYVDDGYVMSDWKVTGAATGRMSSSNPNNQQIPARRMPEYRECFISSHDGGHMIVSDVSQQEPRILAYHSKDPELLSAFSDKEDIHLFVTRAVFGDQTIQRDDPRRFLGKSINLGLSYGMTADGLANRTDLNNDEAEELIQAYFRRFSGVHSWINNQRSVAYTREYVTTASNRRVWLNLHGKWENNAINAPIQGGAADHTKLAMRYVWEEGDARGLPFCVCLVVHDEIVMDTPHSTPEYMELVDDAWKQAGHELFPGIPIDIDTAHGYTWATKK